MDSANTTNNNDSSNWRNELSQNSREKIVNKIMDTLQRHMPFTGPDGMNELKKIALRFEEKIYAAAVDQQDYLRKISLKMLSLRNHVSRDGNSLAGGSSSSNQEPLDPASLPQNEKVIMSASGMQNSAGLPSTLVTEIDANFGHPYHLSTEHVGLDIPLIEASVESSGQTGQSNVIDYQERIYQKVGQDMDVNEAIFESMKMGNIYDLFRQPLLTKYYRRLLFRALTLLSVLGFTGYVIYTSRANSS